MRIIKGVGLLLLGAVLLFFSVKIVLGAPETTDRINSAIQIKNGKMATENEGKLVSVSGTLQPALPLVDPLNGVELPTIHADRKVQAVKGKTVDNKIIFTWEPVNGKTLINDPAFVSTPLAAEAKLGDFIVDPKLIMQLNAGIVFSDYDLANLDSVGINAFQQSKLDTVYLSPEDSIPVGDSLSAANEGKMRIEYTIVDPNDPLEYTIIGIQKGNNLIPDEEIALSNSVHKGIANTQEVAESSKATTWGGAGLAFALAALSIFFGIRVFRQ
ncbi:MAG: hypothetical protein Q4G30_06060 [Actinomycetaceae bacterium]|nr:hypothetical protein [Actinomycetaceae bacterium]